MESLRRLRDEKGVSLRDMASRTGLSFSYLSQIENGLKRLTEKAAKKISKELEVPYEIVLSLGHHEEGQQLLFSEATEFQFEESIIKQAYWATSDFSLGHVHKGSYTKEPYLEDIDDSKTDPAYMAHSYHTKVPPRSIETLIQHYTEEGDIVLDCFAGSGMTGVAARRTSRKCLLSDISPISNHISRGFNLNVDISAFTEECSKIVREMSTLSSWLYKGKTINGLDTYVNYYIWSDLFACPMCAKEATFIEKKFNFKDGIFNPVENSKCECGNPFEKNEWVFLEERIYAVNETLPSGKRSTRLATSEDTKHYEKIKKLKFDFWVPSAPFNKSFEMWRRSHEELGILDVSDFYTKRNLYFLGRLKQRIDSITDEDIRSAALFAFTAAVNRASKRYQFNHKRPTNVMMGTLYVASARYEWNALELFERKVEDVKRYYSQEKVKSQTAVFNSSADSLTFCKDETVDYIFIDPPFGSNIFYSDCSLLWESWLGTFMNRDKEAIVSKKDKEKGIDHYKSILLGAFKECYRVLKSNRFCTVIFNNSDPKVWNVLKESILEAGFEIVAAGDLSKGQKTFKALKSDKEYAISKDAILTLRKIDSNGLKATKVGSKDTVSAVLDFLSSKPAFNFELLSKGDVANLYNSFINQALVSNLEIADVSIARFSEILRSKVQSKASIYESYLQENFLNSKFSTQIKSPSKSFIEYISNSKNPKASIFYNTHSYQTKVPVEFIYKYLEDYSKPGDVVLDPFCGSGMTGLACKLAGRNAHISDLGVLATHIAFNHVRDCNYSIVKSFANEIVSVLEKEKDSPYTVEIDGEEYSINYTLISDIYKCPHCLKENTFWSLFFDAGEAKEKKDEASCESCNKKISKNSLEKIGQKAVLASCYNLRTGKSKDFEVTGRLEKVFDTVSDNFQVPIEDEVFDKNREMYIRSALAKHKVNSFYDFYTLRNLKALSKLHTKIQEIDDLRTRSALMFAFTNTAWHGSIMRRYNTKGGHRPMSGTLYIPQLKSEGNVYDIFLRKIESLEKFYVFVEENKTDAQVNVWNRDARDLAQLPGDSIDYIFTDPPFGANIFYSDCNFLSEKWLGSTTKDESEILMNRSLKPSNGGKTIDFYKDGMRDAFMECSRVLKKDHFMSVVFNSSDGDVWSALVDSLAESGFELNSVDLLDKVQKSMKGYKAHSENTATTDLVLTLKNLKKTKVNSLQVIGRDIDLKTVVKRAADNFQAFSYGETEKFQNTDFFSVFVLYCHKNAISLQGVSYKQVAEKFTEIFS